ncbi:MAG TPA: BTAD domain-containing putative transcriptional regulator [Micropepsaceae bacterium]|nr:BTAD domain-containing putative transcriptional regulator [Micropepsaceae bacterium]
MAADAENTECRARWSLRLFGKFELTELATGANIPVPGKRERALLAYLAVSAGEREFRHKLTTLLWGGDSDATLDNLRNCIFNLRRAFGKFGHQVISSQGREIVLDVSSVDVDVVQFRRLASQTEPESLQQAANLYGGDFLDGLSIASDEFDTWCRDEATRCRIQAVDVLTSAATIAVRAGELQRAIDAGMRALRVDPLHEPTIRLLMHLYRDTGRRSAAVELYRDFAERLKAQLNTHPEQETRDALAQAVEQPELPAQQRLAAISASPVSTETPPPIRSAHIPLAKGFVYSRVAAAAAIAATIAIVTAGSAYLSTSAFTGNRGAQPTAAAKDSSSGVDVKTSSLAASGKPDERSYEQFLQAKSLVRARILGARQAVDMLEPVVARYPDYAPASALLASAYVLTAMMNPQDGIPVLLPKAETAARRAIESDAALSDGYLALAKVERTRGNLVASEDLLLKALGLDPDNPEILDVYMQQLANVGRRKDALGVAERLRSAKPFVAGWNADIGKVLWENGRTREAITVLTPVTEFGAVRPLLAMIYASEGRYSEAADLLEHFAPPVLVASPDSELHHPGLWAAAADMLRAAPSKMSSSRIVPPFYQAGFPLDFVFLYTGAPERALDSYEHVVRSGERGGPGDTFGLLWHSSLADVRKTERFKALMREAGLLDYWRARAWPDLCHPTGGSDFECS